METSILKMSPARSGMLDLHIDPSVLSDPARRSDIIQVIDDLFETLDLRKQYEHLIGECSVIMYAVDDGSITSLLKTHPFGLITITFEECLAVSPFTNPKLEEFRKHLQDKLKTRVEKIPVIKRGAPIPLYFTTSDERLLEYDFDKIVYQADSEYQNIKILHSPTIGNCLILDDLQNLAESDLNYTQGLMKYGQLSYVDKEVLILGGGDGGLLHELLKEKPKFVTMVDIDQMVIDACRQYLRGACGNDLDKMKGANYEIIVDDCIKKLAEYKSEGRTFDVVINDLTDIPISPTPQGELWEFVKKILSMSLDVLRYDGYYLNHAVGESCKESLKAYESVLSTLPVKFKSHSAYVPSFMENWVFYEISKV